MLQNQTQQTKSKNKNNQQNEQKRQNNNGQNKQNNNGQNNQNNNGKNGQNNQNKKKNKQKDNDDNRKKNEEYFKNEIIKGNTNILKKRNEIQDLEYEYKELVSNFMSNCIFGYYTTDVTNNHFTNLNDTYTFQHDYRNFVNNYSNLTHTIQLVSSSDDIYSNIQGIHNFEKMFNKYYKYLYVFIPNTTYIYVYEITGYIFQYKNTTNPPPPHSNINNISQTHFATYDDLINYVKKIHTDNYANYYSRIQILQNEIYVLETQLNNTIATAQQTNINVQNNAQNQNATVPAPLNVAAAVVTTAHKEPSKKERGILDEIRDKYPEKWRQLNDLHNKTDVIEQDYERAKKMIQLRYDPQIMDAKRSIIDGGNVMKYINQITDFERKRDEELTEQHQLFIKRLNDNIIAYDEYFHRVTQLIEMAKNAPSKKQYLKSFVEDPMSITDLELDVEYYLKELQRRHLTVDKIKRNYPEIYKKLMRSLAEIEAETNPHNHKHNSKIKRNKEQKTMIAACIQIIENYDKELRREAGPPATHANQQNQNNNRPPQQQAPPAAAASRNKSAKKGQGQGQGQNRTLVNLTDDFLRDRVAKNGYYQKPNTPEGFANLRKILTDKKMIPYRENGKLYTHDGIEWTDGIKCGTKDVKCAPDTQRAKGGCGGCGSSRGGGIVSNIRERFTRKKQPKITPRAAALAEINGNKKLNKTQKNKLKRELEVLRSS